MDRRAWQAAAHRVAESDTTEQLTLSVSGTSLVAQWVRLHASNAGDVPYSLVRELRSHMLCSKNKTIK